MSGRTYVTEGYGFYTENIELEKLVAFIKNHKEAFIKGDYEKELFEEISALKETEYDEIEEILIDYPCDCSGSTDMCSAVSSIMSRETGIVFAFERGDGEEAVMFDMAYPWWLNEKEKNLTEKELHNIMWIYAEELGLEEKELGYCHVSYWG